MADSADRPTAHAMPDGRVAVYLAAGYRYLSLDAARAFSLQLETAIHYATVNAAGANVVKGANHG